MRASAQALVKLILGGFGVKNELAGLRDFLFDLSRSQ
jgi:hypothetical protein